MPETRQDEPPASGFDPNDAQKVSVQRLGVWTIYTELPQRIQMSRWLDWRVLLQWRPTFLAASTTSNLNYAFRISKSLLQSGRSRVAVYLLASLFGTLFPALILYFSGQMLNLVNSALETRRVDQRWLLYIASARALCVAGRWLTKFIQYSVEEPMGRALRLHFAQHILKSHLRLDVPTYEDAAVARQLESVNEDYSRGPWPALQTVLWLVTDALQTCMSCIALLSLLWDRQESIPLAIVTLIPALGDATGLLRTGYITQYGWSRTPGNIAWAATCDNEMFIRRVGLQKMGTDAKYKQEVVAGNLEGYIEREFARATSAIGAENIFESRDLFSPIGLDGPGQLWSNLKQVFMKILRELPQVVFILQILRTPESMPVTMAAFTIIETTVSSLKHPLTNMFYRVQDLSQTMEDLQVLYELGNITNTVPDGTKPYPENVQDTARDGVSIEFRNVSFKYPGSDSWALRDMSFKVERGSLCVIVGTNGSGKSSILKLITRLYDVTEGEILVDGRDIKTLRLRDLRAVVSTLFQDFKLYPLSIRENIRMGDPDEAVDNDLTEQVAKTCGIVDFMERLPQGLDSYLEHPVPDHFQSLPEGTKTLFGRTVNLKALRNQMEHSRNVSLSGGQSQKVAVARSMIRASVSSGFNGTGRVGLLLFDEPSASLDPEAEYNLFTTLRAIRGNKSMIFSSHRFGNLTRHANLVLFLKNGKVVERGTHDELLAQNGAYAHVWKLQAEAFVQTPKGD
ncbi:P-loop containing nucleoside triphosphate hydrolase protein [Auriculariales sp. MPI-PUGE-AT-0066]|nr:P-loop containing nucleoside triphosphate hydrolase protein [Auriculariales sp. MPI-PUGE-AT-0066]